MQVNTILQGNALEVLKTFPDNSIDCCVTSPPYYALRNYKVKKTSWPAVTFKLMEYLPEITVPAQKCCLGLEKSPVDFVAHIVAIFREVRRTLKPQGTLWLNIGDSYVNGVMNPYNGAARAGTDMSAMNGMKRERPAGIKQKDLLGIPWMVAFALRADGWYLRQDVIWSKDNPMPESVTDRCTKAHEYLFLLAKNKKYYYDAEAIKQEPSESFKNDNRFKTGSNDNNVKQGYEEAGAENPKKPHRIYALGAAPKVNKRSVWRVNTEAFTGAHFATFPQNLIVYCIKASSSEKGCCSQCGKPYQRITEKIKGENKSFNGSSFNKGKTAAAANDLSKVGEKELTAATETVGWRKTCKCDSEMIQPAVVIDPFGGSGTTGIVANKQGRNFVLVEMSADYITIARDRFNAELGLLNPLLQT